MILFISFCSHNFAVKYALKENFGIKLEINRYINVFEFMKVRHFLKNKGGNLRTEIFKSTPLEKRTTYGEN